MKECTEIRKQLKDCIDALKYLPPESLGHYQDDYTGELYFIRDELIHHSTKALEDFNSDEV